MSDQVASKKQEGGKHYLNMEIQPWDVIDTWPLVEQVAYYRGNALRYIMRMNDKDTPETNIRKAKHYCEKLLEVLIEAQLKKQSQLMQGSE